MAGITQGVYSDVRLSFAGEGYESFQTEQRLLVEGLSDFTPFWRDYAAPKFFDDVQRNFETEGSYVGGWKPLNPAYARWKATHYPGKPILQRSERLRRSLEWSGGQVGPGGVARFSERSAEFGTSVPHGRRHQDGAGRLPQRRIIFLPQSAGESYARLLQRYVADVRLNARRAATRAATDTRVRNIGGRFL